MITDKLRKDFSRYFLNRELLKYMFWEERQ